MRRLFIAILPGEAVKEELHALQERLKPHLLGGNLTAKDNLHLTLRFLGEMEEEMLPALRRCLEEAVAAGESFRIRTAGLGAFPRGRRQILWKALEPSPALERLHDDLEASLEAAGIPREDRPFRPHITLGRQLLLEKPLEEIRRGGICGREQTLEVRRITLMESIRVEGILCYVPLYERDLRPGPES